MSLFKLFGRSGKGKDGKPKTPQEAIQEMRGVEELLQKKQAFLEQKIAESLATAKKNANSNKRVALQALKQKKRLEAQQVQIDGQLTNIEMQREMLENAATNTQVLDAMQGGAKALKGVHKNMSADQVHDVLDEIHEQQDIAQEISDALSQPVGFGQNIDEDELNKELEDLAQSELDSQLINVSVPSSVGPLPEAPTHDMPTPAAASASATRVPVAVGASGGGAAKSKKEEDDLKELAEWAN